MMVEQSYNERSTDLCSRTFNLLLMGNLFLDLNFSSQVNNLFRFQISLRHNLAFSSTSVAPPGVPEQLVFALALVCLDFSNIASALDF